MIYLFIVWTKVIKDQSDVLPKILLKFDSKLFLKKLYFLHFLMRIFSFLYCLHFSKKKQNFCYFWQSINFSTFISCDFVYMSDYKLKKIYWIFFFFAFFSYLKRDMNKHKKNITQMLPFLKEKFPQWNQKWNLYFCGEILHQFQNWKFLIHKSFSIFFFPYKNVI